MPLKKLLEACVSGTGTGIALWMAKREPEFPFSAFLYLLNTLILLHSVNPIPGLEPEPDLVLALLVEARSSNLFPIPISREENTST